RDGDGARSHRNRNAIWKASRYVLRAALHDAGVLVVRSLERGAGQPRATRQPYALAHAGTLPLECGCDAGGIADRTRGNGEWNFDAPDRSAADARRRDERRSLVRRVLHGRGNEDSGALRRGARSHPPRATRVHAHRGGRAPTRAAAPAGRDPPFHVAVKRSARRAPAGSLLSNRASPIRSVVG